MAIPAIKSRRGPRLRMLAKLHADEAYDQPDLRRWLRDCDITVRIAREGIESKDKLGKRRWVIERTMAWFTGGRRLTLRYERKAKHFLLSSFSEPVSPATRDSANSPHEAGC